MGEATEESLTFELRCGSCSRRTTHTVDSSKPFLVEVECCCGNKIVRHGKPNLKPEVNGRFVLKGVPVGEV